MKFRKKPVVIEAVQVSAADFDPHSWNAFDGLPFNEFPDWLSVGVSDGIVSASSDGRDYAIWKIKTLEGTMTAEPGDWIIRGVKGELYPCKPDIFAATYDTVEE